MLRIEFSDKNTISFSRRSLMKRYFLATHFGLSQTLFIPLIYSYLDFL